MSLIALAHTASAPPPFSANFLIIATTVIPVLFFALTIQSTVVDRAARTVRTAISQASRGGRQFRMALMAFSVLLSSLAAIGIGVVGEMYAIYALYRQQADTFERQVVLQSVTMLLFAVAAGPGHRVRTVSRRPHIPWATWTTTAWTADSAVDGKPRPAS